MTANKEIRTALYNLLNGNLTHDPGNGPQPVAFYDMRRDDKAFPQVYVAEIQSLDESHKSAILYHIRLQLAVCMLFNETYQSMNIVDDIGSQVETLMAGNLNLGGSHEVVYQFMSESFYGGSQESTQPEGKGNNKSPGL